MANTVVNTFVFEGVELLGFSFYLLVFMVGVVVLMNWEFVFNFDVKHLWLCFRQLGLNMEKVLRLLDQMGL